MPIDFYLCYFLGMICYCAPLPCELLNAFFSALEAHLQFVTGAFARDNGLSTLKSEYNFLTAVQQVEHCQEALHLSRFQGGPTFQ